ncbi:MAG: nickel-responsive transcriptional regulator NikR [Spirochaetes bacterium]|nr:nickel-responsive transcriptional regulator NikR [Spirochaetota bacterium]
MGHHHEKETVIRFGISIEEHLLESFDRYLKKKHYKNRSEAIRDLIRDRLSDAKKESGEEKTVAIVSYLYNHHIPQLTEKIVHMHHHSHIKIYSTQHIHLSRELCLEITIVEGEMARVKDFSNRIQSLKGVQHLTVNHYFLT